jgi:hypothetical protein
MQVALVDMQRRVQSRVPLPWIQVDENWLRAQQAAGRVVNEAMDGPEKRGEGLSRAGGSGNQGIAADGDLLPPGLLRQRRAREGVREPPSDQRLERHRFHGSLVAHSRGLM